MAGLTWIWLTPSSWYSTGSSTVISLLSLVLRVFSAVYRVVVLPLPVGPVTSSTPWGIFSTLCKRCSGWALKPSTAKSSTTLSRLSRRSTTLSPCMVGTVETRMSRSLPCTRISIRPSCGRRRSAMLSRAISLIREITAGDSCTGGASVSCSTPSTR